MLRVLQPSRAMDGPRLVRLVPHWTENFDWWFFRKPVRACIPQSLRCSWLLLVVSLIVSRILTSPFAFFFFCYTFSSLAFTGTNNCGEFHIFLPGLYWDKQLWRVSHFLTRPLLGQTIVGSFTFSYPAFTGTNNCGEFHIFLPGLYWDKQLWRVSHFLTRSLLGQTTVVSFYTSTLLEISSTSSSQRQAHWK